MSRLRGALTPSMIVALLALVVALSGGAYAAGLAKNSVGKAQLKANSVTGQKVKDGSLTLTDLGATERGKLQGATGPAGAPGAAGAKGDPGAVKVTRVRVTGVASQSLASGTLVKLKTIGSFTTTRAGAVTRVSWTGNATTTAFGAGCFLQLRVNGVDSADGTSNQVSGATGPGVLLPNIGDENKAQPIALDAAFTIPTAGVQAVEVWGGPTTANAGCGVGSTLAAGSLVVEEYGAGVSLG